MIPIYSHIGICQGKSLRSRKFLKGSREVVKV
jgi:hypothetical protein